MTETPFPIDFATLELSPKPNQCLVLPEGFSAKAEPHQISRVWRGTDAAALLKAFTEVGLAAPRTELTQEGDGQVELCQKSALFKFPDFITAQAVEVPGGAALCIYSRSRVGYSDLGVNAKRITGWLEQLDVRL
jgi:uncharacterized protein (DUF1499 family)